MTDNPAIQKFPQDYRLAFRKIVGDMPIAIVELDLSLNVIYANKSALDTLLLDNEDIELGVHIKDIVASEQYMSIKEGLERLIRGEPPTPIVLRVRRKDGIEITTETFAEMTLDNGDPVSIVVYSFDMTHRYSVEEKVQRQEGAFRLLVEQSSFVGMLVIDGNYSFEYVNDRLCEIVGRTRSELLGTDFRELLHPDSVALVSERYSKRRAGEDVPGIYDFKIIHKNGSTREVIISSTIMKSSTGAIRNVAQLIDVTEERANQHALSESEQKHRTLVEAIDSGFIIDDEEGFVLSANQPLCDMLGYENPDDIIGTNIMSWTLGWNKTDIAEKIIERKQGRSEHYELELVHRSGKPIPVLIHASPWYSPSGEYIGSFALINDITDLKQTEAEVRFLLDLLLHDLTNQLQLILAGADLLESNLTKDQFSKARRYVIDGADRCLELITNIRRAEEAKSEPVHSVDAITILKSQVYLFGGQYGTTPEIVSLPSSVTVNADQALGHLFWNLMENSVKHNPSQDKKIWISGEIENGYLRLSFSDNGPGLSPTMKSTLFDPTRRSSGVGLHLVRRLATKYGATLAVGDRVFSSPEKGLEITMKFPILTRP